jgi:tetratricopeptide (TPR) repeat protein
VEPTGAEAHKRGVEALNSRRFEDAETWLGRALTHAATPADEARARASLAFLTYERGDLAGAFAEIERAAGVVRDDPDTRGVVLCQQALLLLRAGRTDEALAAFASSIGLLSDPVERGRALINRGGVHLAQGNAVEARDDFAAAAVALGTVDQPLEAEMAVHNLGYAEFLLGDLVGALRHIDAARPVLSAQSEVGRATCSQDRAEVLLAAGLVSEGRAELDDAASAYEREGIRQRSAEARLTLARAVAPHDPATAQDAAEAAAAAFRDLGADAWRARAEAVAWAARVEQGEHGAGTLEQGRVLADELDRQGLRWPATAVRLGEVRIHLTRGEWEEATRVLDDLEVLADAPLDTRLLARDARAARAAATGEPAEALDHVRAGLGELHAWQSSFGSLDLQTNVVGHGVRLAVRGLSLAARSPSDAVLFEWSERARMLASRIQPVRAPQDARTAADLAELRSGPAPVREAELRRRIREQAWQHRGSGEVTDPLELVDLRARLPEDTALVAHVVTPDRVVALVVTSTGTARHDLGDRARLDDALGGLLADLDMAAAELPASLAGSVRGTLARRLEVVASALVAPLLGDLGPRRVVLTPSGVLAGVPWTLLPGLVGRPVTVAQSATSWVARSTAPLRTSSAGFVAGPRVVRAEAEVRAAATAWGSAPVLAGDDATAGAVSALAGRVDVLHVAAHGRHSAENPLFSGLELADGTWFGYDIDQLPAVPDAVLLSACEVGRSSVRWGEELIGMTAAWLHAGARCVVASPAAVNDATAHDVLVQVHAALAEGADPATALAGTVAPVSADAAPAPFVCFG